MEKRTSRRKLLGSVLKGSGALFLTSTFLPSLISACKKANPEQNTHAATNAKMIDDIATTCPEQASLTEQEKAIRSSLKYVDQTPIAQRTCDNCKLYTLPSESSICGGCKVVPGPIHPKGYCAAWIARM